MEVVHRKMATEGRFRLHNFHVIFATLRCGGRSVEVADINSVGSGR